MVLAAAVRVALFVIKVEVPLLYVHLVHPSALAILVVQNNVGLLWVVNKARAQLLLYFNHSIVEVDVGDGASIHDWLPVFIFLEWVLFHSE